MAFVAGRRKPGLAVLSSRLAGDARAADDAFSGRAADSGEIGRPPSLRGRNEGTGRGLPIAALRIERG